jgi:hypothetical protein
MKFLFIENRGKTAFWQHVAGELHRHGHDIAWLVQNPQYVPHAPDGVAVHVLPFPPGITPRSSPTAGAGILKAAKLTTLTTVSRSNLCFVKRAQMSWSARRHCFTN